MQKISHYWRCDHVHSPPLWRRKSTSACGVSGLEIQSDTGIAEVCVRRMTREVFGTVQDTAEYIKPPEF